MDFMLSLPILAHNGRAQEVLSTNGPRQPLEYIYFVLELADLEWSLVLKVGFEVKFGFNDDNTLWD